MKLIKEFIAAKQLYEQKVQNLEQLKKKSDIMVHSLPEEVFWQFVIDRSSKSNDFDERIVKLYKM